MYILPVFIRSHLWLNLNLFVPVYPRGHAAYLFSLL